MRIAVIGTGRVGSTLAVAWSKAGHDVVYGTRGDVDEGPGGVPATAIGAAIGGAEVVVIAVPGNVVDDLLAQYGRSIGRAVVIDAANKVGASVLNSRESIGHHAPEAAYVRAFNSLGWENFAEPTFDGVAADLFYAAAPAARDTAERLIADVGLRPMCVGSPAAADVVDGVTRLWFALTSSEGHSRHLAFRVLERD